MSDQTRKTNSRGDVLVAAALVLAFLLLLVCGGIVQIVASRGETIHHHRQSTEGFNYGEE